MTFNIDHEAMLDYICETYDMSQEEDVPPRVQIAKLIREVPIPETEIIAIESMFVNIRSC